MEKTHGSRAATSFRNSLVATASGAIALHLGSCFVHCQFATVKLGSVELRNRLCGIFLAHFHKTKAAGSASVTVRNDPD